VEAARRQPAPAPILAIPVTRPAPTRRLTVPAQRTAPAVELSPSTSASRGTVSA
jgi:hypothetical protein